MSIVRTKLLKKEKKTHLILPKIPAVSHPPKKHLAW